MAYFGRIPKHYGVGIPIFYSVFMTMVRVVILKACAVETRLALISGYRHQTKVKGE